MRNKKSSMFEDLVEIAAMLPWHVGAGLAVIAYIVLHHFAGISSNNPAVTSITDLAGSVKYTLISTACGFLQYIIPIALLLGAGVSLYKRGRMKKHHEAVAAAPNRESLEKLSWLEFEGLVTEMFRRKGYTVGQRGGRGPDGGVDIELHMGQDKYLVQCKQWKTWKVGVATVRELYGVMAAEGAIGGFVVASGHFTEEAKRFAEGKSIQLIASESLLELVTSTRTGKDAHTPAPTLTAKPAPKQVSEQPACPNCGSSMVQRTAKTGQHAGARFWGCVAYPKCRGIAVIRNDHA